MKTLKLLSVLLSYPQKELKDALSEIGRLVGSDRFLKAQDKKLVLECVRWLEKTELVHLQETYVGLFDRNRSLSLHLFEHVYGESRQRGQAMVDLLQLYERDGFEIAEKELPDYIPMFLEYLSHQAPQEARALLAEVKTILTALSTRLLKQDSPYHGIFGALTNLAGAPAPAKGWATPELIQPSPCQSEGDDEEKPVTFSGAPSECQAANPSCGGCPLAGAHTIASRKQS